MKKWYTSKTVWFNILTIGGAVFAGLGGILPALGPVLSVETYQILLFVVGFLNLLLRNLTNGPIKWTDKPAKGVPVRDRGRPAGRPRGVGSTPKAKSGQARGKEDHPRNDRGGRAREKKDNKKE